jgi:uncharacterized membrane protein
LDSHARQGDGEGSDLARVLERNIEALLARRKAEERRKAWSERLSDRITRFVGSMTFVLLHVAITLFWVVANVGLLPGVPRFDESFVKLATAASVEAIFVTTFVLVTQNRMAAAADKRADLDLQISLLSEHEVTRLIRLVGAIAARLGVEEAKAPDLPELERDVEPETVLDRIERAEERSGSEPRPPA